MLIHVFGRVGDGPVLHRPATLRQVVQGWGPWARAVLSAREDRPLQVGGRSVWVRIVQ